MFPATYFTPNYFPRNYFAGAVVASGPYTAALAVSDDKDAASIAASIVGLGNPAIGTRCSCRKNRWDWNKRIEI